MTEVEWLSCNDPEPMLGFLKGKVGDRKLRLFGVACCRRIWHVLRNARSRLAVEVAERYADGFATVEELAKARDRAVYAWHNAALGIARPETFYDVDEEAAEGAVAVAAPFTWAPEDEPRRAAAVVLAARHAANAYSAGVVRSAMESQSVGEKSAQRHAFTVAEQLEKIAQVALLRELFGNPFRHVSIDRSSLSPDLIALAQMIYNERAFERMSELSGALKAVGCKDANILDHCRGEGPHVRGCWVVDLLLGKE